MKFVKENLAIVIAAAVAVLAIVAGFVYPVPGMLAAKQTEMQERLSKRDTIKKLEGTVVSLPGQDDKKGIPSQEAINIKNAAIASMEAAKKQVDEASVALNSRGRVTGPINAPVPLLPLASMPNGKEELGFLPKLRVDSMSFKSDYVTLFPQWVSLLSTGVPGDVDMDSAMPPSADALKADFDAQQKKLPGYVANSSGDSGAVLDFQRRKVTERATNLRMYVEKNAFQIRGWADPNSTAAPSEQDIFEALVDGWLQSDVVKAIVATNQLRSPNPTDKTISNSVVKRLTHITIGANARARATGGTASGQTGGSTGGPAGDSAGPLFLTAANASGGVSGVTPTQIPTNGSPATPAAADPLANVPSNTINYDVSMTGHSAGKEYDVVLMDIVIDIDPSYLNAFFDQLYRQNMGYTVVGLQQKTVDPLDRASNGYLYGDGQVVEADIQVEALLLHNWTVPLMPDAERGALGIGPVGK